ncbi:SNARE-interacting protein KEULE, partial [Bienertia sinuspersici]
RRPTRRTASERLCVFLSPLLIVAPLDGRRRRLCAAAIVLIMDKFTVKVMSNACKMADITNAGVSLVEDIYKKRQPLPTMDAIYFIQPSKENVVMLMSDMAGKKPLYKKAFVFFSSPIARELVVYIREDATVSPRIVVCVS